MSVKNDNNPRASALLNSVKLRRTKPRTAVLSALLAAGSPQSAEEIASKLRRRSPNKVTIYRILEILVKVNLVHKVFLQDRTWYFELSHNCTQSQCHPHFTCTSCERTHCLHGVSVPLAKSPHKGFVINHQRVQLEGLCPQCSGKSNMGDISQAEYK